MSQRKMKNTPNKRERIANTKWMKYGVQTYHVRNTRIKSISLTQHRGKTVVKVMYKGGKFEEYAFSIPFENGVINIKEASRVYASLMSLNDELIKEKEMQPLFV